MRENLKNARKEKGLTQQAVADQHYFNFKEDMDYGRIKEK